LEARIGPALIQQQEVLIFARNGLHVSGSRARWRAFGAVRDPLELKQTISMVPVTMVALLAYGKVVLERCSSRPC